MTDSVGLYLHIPFCEKKCAYCDFYSAFLSESLIDGYISALSKEIKRWGGLIDRPIDTVYIGGGTPSLLNGRVETVMSAVMDSFNVTSGAEITAEANPDTSEEFLKCAYKSGVNRLSIGVQSANEDELKLLGRTHTVKKVVKSYELARDIGFDNISLDLMLGLPFSSEKSLANTLGFFRKLEPEHISAYILKIEPNTYLAKQNISELSQEEIGSQYQNVCNYLKNLGYGHYEISNFAKAGYESRHNLRYWQLSDYIGIGPSAHSLLDGKRFYYEKNIKKFINNPQTVFDCDCDEIPEKLMLNLRLCYGIDMKEFFYGNASAYTFAKRLESEGLATSDGENLRLTDKGMLVSNSIICEFLEML